MEAKRPMIESAPCSSPLPELEVPMINTMVACLGSEHKKLNQLIMQLACVATRLAGIGLQDFAGAALLKHLLRS